MMNEKNTRSLFRAEKSRAPKTVIGLLIGMLLGILIGWYFGKPTAGLGPGMLVGATVGVCSDAALPRGARIAWGIFVTCALAFVAFQLRPFWLGSLA